MAAVLCIASGLPALAQKTSRWSPGVDSLRANDSTYIASPVLLNGGVSSAEFDQYAFTPADELSMNQLLGIS